MLPSLEAYNKQSWACEIMIESTDELLLKIIDLGQIFVNRSLRGQGGFIERIIEERWHYRQLIKIYDYYINFDDTLFEIFFIIEKLYK